MSYTENFDAHAPRLASVGEATRLPGNPVTGDTIVVSLPLTDEEIEAKVAELVDRKFRELIEASASRRTCACGKASCTLGVVI